MSLKDATVFLTGGFGFVGSNLALHLDAQGAHVVALRRDELQRTNPLADRLAERVSVVRGDLQDFDTVVRALNEYEVDLCFHLAAQSIVRVAGRNPLSTFASNIHGTWNVLEACRQAETLEGLVVASSDKAYGTSTQLPYRETDPLQGRNPYEASKACADILAQCYGAAYGLPVVISRCSNIYGQGDLNFSRIVPDICRSVALGQPPRLRTDGAPLRDFVHVDDVLRAYERIGRALLEGGCGHEIFNIGSGKPTRVLDVTNLIIDISGKGLNPFLGPPSSPGEIPDQYVAIDRIRKALGWRPRVGLQEGLKTTFQWYSDYFRTRT